jgi:Cu/Ag efflux protein CusF
MRKLIIAAALTLASSLAFAQAVPANGQVTKVDAAQGKITLKHGPIKNLDMDSMTMVFRAGDPAMLKAVKPGDRVVFEAERVNGQITITKLRKAP